MQVGGKGEGDETAQRGTPISHPCPCARSKKSLSLPSGRALKHFSVTHGPPGRRTGAAEGGRAKARPPRAAPMGVSLAYAAGPKAPRETPVPKCAAQGPLGGTPRRLVQPRRAHVVQAPGVGGAPRVCAPGGTGRLPAPSTGPVLDTSR